MRGLTRAASAGSRRFAVSAVRRTARLLGFELTPALQPGEACMQRLKEIRARLGQVDPQSRRFLEFCLENLTLSRSDILQDLFVLFETGTRRAGYFVEFGAADGIAGSNTYALEREFGWTGILAEPAQCWHDALARNRSCIVDRRCVTDRTGDTVLFRECRYPANSTIDSYADHDRFRAVRRRGFRRYAVPTVSLGDLLREHEAPEEFDYLSVDTEGSEAMILGGLDFGAYRPKVITVEHCHSPARERLFALLSAQGYRRKHAELSQIDDWYVRG